MEQSAAAATAQARAALEDSGAVHADRAQLAGALERAKDAVLAAEERAAQAQVCVDALISV